MHEIKIKLKSGNELNMFCKEYRIETSTLDGNLMGFKYEGAYGEVPLFLSLTDVECITEIIERGEGMKLIRYKERR